MLRPVHKIYTFMSFCLSLSGSAIWSLACPQPKSLEVTFNNILRKIWGLHASSVSHQSFAPHCCSCVFNVVCDRSLRLVNSAINSNSNILHDVFYQSSKLAYCFAGYNCVYGRKHRKLYTEQDKFLPASCEMAWRTLHSTALRFMMMSLYFSCLYVYSAAYCSSLFILT